MSPLLYWSRDHGQTDHRYRRSVKIISIPASMNLFVTDIRVKGGTLKVAPILGHAYLDPPGGTDRDPCLPIRFFSSSRPLFLHMMNTDDLLLPLRFRLFYPVGRQKMVSRSQRNVARSGCFEQRQGIGLESCLWFCIGAQLTCELSNVRKLEQSHIGIDCLGV